MHPDHGSVTGTVWNGQIQQGYKSPKSSATSVCEESSATWVRIMLMKEHLCNKDTGKEKLQTQKWEHLCAVL